MYAGGVRVVRMMQAVGRLPYGLTIKKKQMGLQTYRDQFDLDTQLGYLNAIEQFVKDAPDRSVLDGISFLKELELVKQGGEYEKHFLQFYRFAFNSLSSIVNI